VHFEFNESSLSLSQPTGRCNYCCEREKLCRKEIESAFFLPLIDDDDDHSLVNASAFAIWQKDDETPLFLSIT
jgi:hypothetical protein